jgi:single-strand DNA-binding protein
MNTAQLTIEGNVAVNPTLRFTPSGVPVAELVVLVNNRRKIAGEWKDDEPTRFRITAWEQLAENLAASVAVGDRLIVIGRLYTESYLDREADEKRTAQRMTAEAIGYSLRFHTVKAEKNVRERRWDEGQDPADPTSEVPAELSA